MSKAASPRTGKNFIHLDELPDGTWRLLYSPDLIPDFTKITGLKIVREEDQMTPTVEWIEAKIALRRNILNIDLFLEAAAVEKNLKENGYQLTDNADGSTTWSKIPAQSSVSRQ